MLSPPLRNALGLAALAGLAGLAIWVELGRADLWPALAVAESSFRLSGVEPGRYAWRLEDGRVPQGPGLLAQRALVFERNDLVALELAPGLVGGATVKAGQPLASLRSTLLEEQTRTLVAERDLVAARKALLEAGPRPETVEAARKAVAVARALAEGARPELDRAQKLVSQGAGSATELELAALNARVNSLQAELAAAQLAEVGAAARPEELAALDAELAAVEARIAYNQARIDQNQLVSPIDGVLQLGQVTELTGDTTVLRVDDVDPLILRIPVPQHDRAHMAVGQRLRFESRGLPDDTREVEVIGISQEATPLNGQQVFWVAAKLDNPDGSVQPGISGWVSREGLVP